jgi:hypothetical protein
MEWELYLNWKTGSTFVLCDDYEIQGAQRGAGNADVSDHSHRGSKVMLYCDSAVACVGRVLI